MRWANLGERAMVNISPYDISGQHKPAPVIRARAKARFYLPILALAAFFTLSQPPISDALAAETKPKKKTVKQAPPKKKPQASALDDNWQKTFALIGNKKDPVAQKLVVWLYATETEIAADPKALMQFAAANPEWPRLHQIRRKIEPNIADVAKPADIAVWFKNNPPLTYDGLKAYLDALLASGQTEAARQALSDLWPEMELKKNQVSSIASSYKKLFAAGAHQKRLDNLIWSERFDEAEAMLAFVSADQRSVGHARLSLARQRPDASTAVGKVPQALSRDEGLVFERMRYRRRKDPGDGALEMLAMLPAKQTRPDIWWKEIHILARRAIEKKDSKSAYRITARHQTFEGSSFAQAEWLLGWISLRYLNDAAAAYRHFDKMYRSVDSAISRARAAHWAALASEKLKEQATADQWHKIAAYYPSTFYGQISLLKIVHDPGKQNLVRPQPTETEIKIFEARELTRAIRLLHQAKLTRLADPFFAKLLSLARTPSDYTMIARLALGVDRRYYAVEANKQAQQNIGFFISEEGYPMLPFTPPKKPESSIVHSIVYRESMFDTKALSTAGARGLMQLMPATAKRMAKQLGRGYSLDNLTAAPKYNVTLGSHYLNSLIEDYNGFYPMAIAAYNAGPGRVKEWNAQFGDPRRGEIDVIDWVEQIPFYETRNYVQRVMETYFIYRIKHGLPPRSIHDFISRAQSTGGKLNE